MVTRFGHVGWTLPLELLLVVRTHDASFRKKHISAAMEIAYCFCNSSIIVLSIFLVIIFCRFLSNRSTFRLPPSPPSLPILGHAHLLLGSTPHCALQKLSIRYGPLLYLRIGCVPVVVASSPSLAREFLNVHGSSFSSRPHITLLDTLLYGRLRICASGALMENNEENMHGGAPWRQVAPTLQLHSAAGERLLLTGHDGERWDTRKSAEIFILDGLMEEVVKEHQRMEKTVESKDIIDVLLKSIKKDKEEGEITKENVKSLILDVFFTGIHTASIPLQFGLMELVRHPSVLLKAQAEMDSVVGKKRLVEERDLANLPYLKAIVKETLRLHPAVPMVPRASTEDCRVGEYDIPANTWVFVNVWAMGKDPWDSPSEFRPERFLGSPVNVKGEYFELLPFGSGLRMCPGSAHALLVFCTVLAGFIQCFDWEVDGGPKRLDVEERSGGMTVSMANKLICRPIPRFDALIVEYKSANEYLNDR
ncbi:3,9-dihydroxypterocarpan 6A-monooxygenase-like [Nymphaea colorata]|nr:3,9-dihydroxypterocarpan 6A-monooxygenase-like [Nymphaea colorata]